MVWSEADARSDSHRPMSPARARVARPSVRRAARDRRRQLLALATLGVLFAALALAVAPAWNPVWYQDDQLPTLFRTFHTDLAHHRGVWYPRLAHATTEERDRWRLIGQGEGIHWPDLDEDISVDNLLAGRASGESQASLRRWLEGRDRH